MRPQMQPQMRPENCVRSTRKSCPPPNAHIRSQWSLVWYPATSNGAGMRVTHGLRISGELITVRKTSHAASPSSHASMASSR